MPVIHVVAALVVDPEGRMCLVRKRGTAAFMQPGGKPEPGETLADALRRELTEELALDVPPESLQPLGRFEAAAANEPDHIVVADVFRLVTHERPAPHAEIEEVRWAAAAEALALGDRLAPLARRLLPLAAEDRERSRTRDAYDRLAGAYAAALPGLDAEGPVETRILQRFLARLPRGGRMLDAGCGAGRMLAHITRSRPDLTLAGIDLSPGMARHAAAACPTAHVATGDLLALPLADGAVDGALAWYSLIHLAPDELPPAFAELRRVLAPSGVLLVGVQAGEGERSVQRAYGRDVDLTAHLHAVRAVEDAARAAGFEPRSRAERGPRAGEQHRQAFLVAERPADATTGPLHRSVQ